MSDIHALYIEQALALVKLLPRPKEEKLGEVRTR